MMESRRHTPQQFSSAGTSDAEESRAHDEYFGRTRSNLQTISPPLSSSPDTSLETSSELDLPRFDDVFNDLVEQHRAYVDKTFCLTQLPSKYSALLVRPPRFGKTALVSTFEEYYDVRGVVTDDRWEQLDAYKTSKNSFASRDRHLCLHFCFQNALLRGQLHELEEEIRIHVCAQLYAFLWKYLTELGLSNISDAIETAALHGEPDIRATFAKFWDIVKQSGYTLFVGVDDYDGPIRSHDFFPFESHNNEVDRPGFRDAIEEIMVRLFWRPLLDGMDIISKLLVTGTHPLSSFTRQLTDSVSKFNLQELPELALSCGFTEDETQDFSRQFFEDRTPIIKFQDFAGQYCFPPYFGPELLLHPQEIILHVAESMGRDQPPLLPFASLSAVLQALEEDADDARVTINVLVDMITQGTIETGQYQPRHGQAFGVETLRDMGILSYDANKKLRIANKRILDQMHWAVYPWADAKFRLGYKLLPALALEGGFPTLLSLCTNVLLDRTRRALSRKSNLEPTMHGVFELLFRSPVCSSRDSFDSFILVAPEQLPYFVEDVDPNGPPRKWKLRTLALRGLWRGSHANDANPSFEALTILHTELQTMDEVKIRQMPYLNEQGVVSQVEEHLRDEPGIHILVAVGGARVLMPQIQSPEGTSSRPRCEKCGHVVS
ncbi:AAA-ATPase-like domain-containing protein [Mycena indigotica]|uniref:AAA-ATPase-like domain-containing protein n=1 Tax=Mycena indigotica TaxID=2126181 RepID=A0A8H6TFG4_9AGAR|nr:AAA-ATPase-like domain-containing protein [Mycena indigotica]KAF7316386.1 AAA-ATPase-like domain-containing protein [Mycena indigotica]